jgi:TRAP-type C4-dicarboxylate transport system substrate-binding protein
VTTITVAGGGVPERGLMNTETANNLRRRQVRKLTGGWSAAVRILVVILIATGCGSGPSQGSNGKVYKIVFSGHLTPTDPATKSQYRFAELAKSLSNGRLDVQVFVNNQLGKVQAGYSQLHAGATQMEMLTPDHMVPYGSPNLGIPSLPFLFSSPDEAQKALNAAPGQQLGNEAVKAGFEVLGWGDVGMQELETNKSVATLQDLRGLKVRTVAGGGQAVNDAWRALGAVPVAVDYSELPIDMRTGVVQGMPIPLVLFMDSGLNEVANHVLILHWVYGAAAYTMNLAFFKSLPSDLQAVVKKAAQQAGKELVAQNASQLDDAIAQLKAKGVTVTTLDPTERERWVAAVKPVMDTFAQQNGPLVNAFLNYQA